MRLEEREHLESTGRFDLIDDRAFYGSPENIGWGGSVEPSDFEDESLEVVAPDYENMSLSDRLVAETQELIFVSAQAADYDPSARQALAIAETLLESLQRLQEAGRAFEGSTEEELDALVDTMHEANPEADEEELTTLVYELIDYIESTRLR